MAEDPPFRTVLRGYDPDQVRSALDELQTSVVTARRITADRTIELTRMQEQLAQAQSDLEAATARLRERESHPGAPSVTDVGARIGSILALANEEAEELRAAGREDARRRVEEADSAIMAARSEAEREAQQLLGTARQDAERVTEEARQRAAAVVQAATRDADRHRVQAAAVAAFGAEVDRHVERLQQASTRVEQLAQEEASLIQRQAAASAERIRQDTDHQLAAVDARRQSITAQLDTVGALLRELGQAVKAGPTSGDGTGSVAETPGPAFPDGEDHSGEARSVTDGAAVEPDDEPNGLGRPGEVTARH